MLAGPMRWRFCMSESSASARPALPNPVQNLAAEEAMRICKHCRQALPPEAFHLDKRVLIDGRTSVCKPCTRAHRKGRHTVGRRRYPSKEKDLARGRVRDAVRYGRMTKPDRCQQCQAPTPRHLLDGHHHDYTRPLEVTWLCRACHGLESLTWKQAA